MAVLLRLDLWHLPIPVSYTHLDVYKRQLLKLKPVLQIQGEKLDAFAKARTVKQAKSIMIDAMKSDFERRFNNPDGSQINLEMAYTHDIAACLLYTSRCV